MATTLAHSPNNLPTLAQIVDEPGILAGLGLAELQLILDNAAEAAKVPAAAAKAVKSHIDTSLAASIAAAYAAKGSDTGTVHVLRDGYDVEVNRPKKVDWDQAKLAAVVDKIRAGGDDVSEYVKVTYAVEEKKFTAWPSMIRAMFEPARTVAPGNPAIKLDVAKDVAA